MTKILEKLKLIYNISVIIGESRGICNNICKVLLYTYYKEILTNKDE